MVKVLDKGFVELVDVMGDEQEVARAARISYGRHDDRSMEQDMKLTRYLHENEHTSPFEMIELKWRVKCPIFVARQWVRHRTANMNEFSMRYAEPHLLSEDDQIDFYIPEQWRHQDRNNRQGSADRFVSDVCTSDYTRAVLNALDTYDELIRMGVSREMARMVLPVSVYTEFVWKNDLHNTLRFLRLRTDPHAQWEIRQYANTMVDMLKERFPNLMAVVWPC